MNDHNFEYISETFGSHNYTQHNLGMPDGMNGLVDYIKAFVKKFPEYMYDVKHIVASGDMVVFHTHMVTKEKNLGNDKKGFIIMDRWRVENGEIREHWDSIQAINGFF